MKTSIKFKNMDNTTCCPLIDLILHTGLGDYSYHQTPIPLRRLLEPQYQLSHFLPATPYGITEMLKHYNIPTEGKHCVVIGRSHIVGSPMSVLMARNAYPGNCTVTITHSKTQNLKAITSQADILIVAIGKPEFLTADMVKEGAVVIDVGGSEGSPPAFDIA